MNRVACLHIVGGGMLAIVLVACEPSRDDADRVLPTKSERTADTEPQHTKNKGAITLDLPDRDLLLLNQHAGTKTTYGAERTEEDKATGVVTLTGRAWVRMGDVILDGRGDPNSVIRFDPTTGRAVSKNGQVDLVTLLNSLIESQSWKLVGLP